mmetsp:Transcript_20234/g.65003  ORF Transcript_20234/g.65003 Transcript_20234/m.65003 type:complete len:331 (-) Transcript_20234:790-1782(-)
MSVKRVDAFWGEELGGKGALATSLEAAVGYELLRCVAMLCAAHTVGVLHHFHHARGMWRHLVLEARQRALMRCIEEETATCDRLLKSILPPHLVRSLGSLDLEQGPGSHGVGSGPSASHHGSSTGTASTSADWYAATGRAEASCSSGGGGGGDLPDRAERVERISRGEFGTVQPSARRAGFDRPARPQRAQLAESFSECAFLFAKVDGLSALLNDATAEPPRVIKLLQSMFDRFDRLADVFQLQKARTHGWGGGPAYENEIKTTKACVSGVITFHRARTGAQDGQRAVLGRCRPARPNPPPGPARPRGGGGRLRLRDNQRHVRRQPRAAC